MRALAGVVAGTLLLAGCGGGDHRRLEIAFVSPAVDDRCGPPAPGGVVGVEIFALGDFVEIGASGAADEGVATDLFPARTRALRLALLGPGGGVVRAGRTGTLDLGVLADGATLPVLVGPPRGFCRVGDLAQGRRRPLVARAGAGVLVVGGLDGDGGVVGLAELYDPARGGFVIVDDAPFDDLRGATATTLADGRVLITFADGYQLFTPEDGAAGPGGRFGPALLAQGAELRPGAQAVRLADGRVAVLGGCAAPALGPPCDGATDAAIFDPASDELSPAPALAVARADGAAWLDGDGRVVLVGGWGAGGAPAATIELWDPVAGSAATLAGAAGASAPLPAGGLVAGFAPAGATAAGGALALAPLADTALAAPAIAARAGATRTPLDDGAVLAVGGLPDGAGAAEAELFAPHAGRWEALAAEPGARRREHAALRLDDGSVLVVGGADALGVRRDAWIYRHDLTGPWSTLPTQIFGFAGAPLVVPADLGSASILAGPPARLVLSAVPRRAGALGAWAVLTGATYAELELTVSLDADAGATPALLLGFTGAGDHELILLPPGQEPTLATVTGAQPGAPRCTGPSALAAGAFADSAPHTLELRRRDDRLVVELDGERILDCADDQPRRGAVGVGVAGGTGAAVRVRTLEARR